MTEKERIRLAEAEYRRRNRALGMTHAKLWVHTEDIDHLKSYAENLRLARGIILDQRRKDAIKKPVKENRSLDDMLAPYRKKANKIEAKQLAEEREARRLAKQAAKK